MSKALLLSGVAALCVFASNVVHANPPVASTRLSAMDSEIDPFYGRLNPFYGRLNPFYGKISPFWGNINPFWGKISPFWGSITPFYGSVDPFWGNISPFYGKINPFWGTVQPFWQDMGPLWGNLDASWAQLQTSSTSDYSGLKTQLQDFLSRSSTFWGDAIKKQTGKSFMDGFAQPLLTKYGIDPSNPRALANVTPESRSAFFLDWYDGLMNFTGVDHVDWWMAAVHWNPMITQIQGSGDHYVVGLLDSSVSDKDKQVEHLEFRGGFKSYANGHGAAVASLISARHDGVGVMGIAPKADVKLYNPFDNSGTASWEDVEKGIFKLYKDGAFVINLSLGVPGWTLSSEWANILTSSHVSDHNRDLVLVKAAGNEGVVQTADISWIGNQAPQNLILVGSTAPDGSLSSFSNSPGEACILVNDACNEQNKLKYRFLVAPGELILVSDNNGGVTRMTGTSFAAPLVTGAVALLQDRWPWLRNYAEETVQIILQSARDLGAPGVDPVYGWGMLDVEASQSPLDFNNLVVYQPTAYRDGLDYKTVGAATWAPTSLKSAIMSSGQLNLWQQQNAFIVAFEAIGDTYRDFSIPLSSALVGKTLHSNGVDNQFQSYIYQRLIDWGRSGFSDFASNTSDLGKNGAWTFSMAATAPSADDARRDERPFHSEVVATNRVDGMTLRMGEGNGAHALSSDSGFAFTSDYNPSTGGVNPILGFASGGAYAGGALSIGGGAHLNFGFTQQADDHTVIDPVRGRSSVLPLTAYEASASTIGIDWTLGQAVTLNTSYTRLNEASGLLGAQGSGALGLSGGAQTDALTWGANADLPGGIALMGSATIAQTSATQFNNSSLAIGGGGLRSSAYEFAALKTGVFNKTDHVRFSVAQPLHVDSGSLQYKSVQIIDRSTGELGSVNQTWNIASGDREYRTEVVYATSVFGGRGEVSGFGLIDIDPPTQVEQSQNLMLGGRIRLGL